MPVRVALRNDYEIVKHGLAAMLQDHTDRVEVVDETCAPDIVLVDAFGRLAPTGDALARIVQETDAAVVVYGWDGPQGAAREHGVAGVVHGKASGAELADALVAVHERVGATAAGPDGWRGQETGLSPREVEILELIVRGCSNQEIADRTFLSVNTVKTYIRTCYRKIGAVRRSQAVVWGMRHGFADEQVLSAARD